jgi:hypothetical protein
MVKKFKVGNHVTWNSEAGHVSGRITKIHKKDVQCKGYTHHATADDPQYEIKSDKTEHVAMHKGSALKKKDSRGDVAVNVEHPAVRREAELPLV